MKWNTQANSFYFWATILTPLKYPLTPPVRNITQRKRKRKQFFHVHGGLAVIIALERYCSIDDYSVIRQTKSKVKRY
eukprot:scaffold1185_cov143-Skeletonema_menzelii.AAC.16